MKNYVLNYWFFTLLLLATLSCSDINDELSDNQADKNNSAFTESMCMEGELIELPNGTKVLKSGEQYLFEGDILLTKEQVEIIGSKSELRSTLTKNVAQNWPNSIVYYTINSSLSDSYRITDAFKHWEQNTNIRFVRRTTETDYVEFVSGGGCSSSHIGRIGGRQQISLETGCSTGNAIHEIGHAVGLWHEQTRPDRDNFITINWDNIIYEFRSQFDLSSLNYAYGQFDFSSIMMYPSNAFSRNNQPTITRKDGSTFTTQRNGLSSGDIVGVNSIYTSLLYPRNINLTVSNEGYIHTISLWSQKNSTTYLPLEVVSKPSWVTNLNISNYLLSGGNTNISFSALLNNYGSTRNGTIVFRQAETGAQVVINLSQPIATNYYSMKVQMGNSPYATLPAVYKIEVDGLEVRNQTWNPYAGAVIVENLPYSLIRYSYSSPSTMKVTLEFKKKMTVCKLINSNLKIVSGGVGSTKVEITGKVKDFVSSTLLSIIQL